MRLNRSRAAGVVLGLSAALALAACSSSSDPGGEEPAEADTDAEVTISVGGLPPTEEAESRQSMLDRIDSFEEQHPNITIEPEETKWAPDTFIPMLQGGTLPTTLNIPFTEIQSLIARGQVYDVTSLVEASDTLSQIDPSLLELVQDGDGNVFGLPYQAYTMAINYNRSVFTEAGLDPDDPPTTWDEVREAAQQISENTDATGFAAMTKENTGGWILTTMSYAFGATMQDVDDDGAATATFADNDATAEALEFYRTLRWEDDSMGSNFLLNQDDVMNALAAGQIGMVVNGADGYGGLVTNRGMAPDDFGVVGMPQADGGIGTLGGGSIAMVSPNATPEEAAAAVAWIEYQQFERYIDEDAAVEWAETRQADGLPVYPPFFPVLGGDAQAQYDEWIDPFVDAPVENWTPYTSTISEIPLVPEPAVKAQELYATLDSVVQAVLTDENADIDALLADAQASVQQQIDAG